MLACVAFESSDVQACAFDTYSCLHSLHSQVKGLFDRYDSDGSGLIAYEEV